ncbi:type II secretion system protein GspM [Longimicrobium sp.]|uniref:type II secretion system protein GspM n=1 Tax=Longimicrobium sp. TaxID=2029185 RepID=UPI002BA9485A|nr:type II secretion system protein GspM [Longimicrobium sp.]HSU15695.1 type II secretion system protein GspM [Longimicrobium sp.]
MRAIRITPRDRRTIALGMAFVVPALLWSLVLAPYLHALSAAKAKLRDEQGLLRRELELLAQARSFPTAFGDGAKKLLAVAPRLTGGNDDAAAGAAVAGYVRSLARMGGANVTRVDPAPVRDAGGGITALPVAVTGEADLEGLMTFLQMLENGPKLVRVDELKIEADDGPVSAGASYSPTPFFVAPGGGSEIIRFGFTATGYALATGKPVPAQRDSAEAGR